MPFAIRKLGRQFVVINKNTGHVKGTHPTREQANKQLAALHASGADKHGRKR